MSVKEIAKRAKVSIGTVDRVLHDRGRVSEQTKRRVRKVIADISTSPTSMPGISRSRRTFRFGVLLPALTQDNGYWQLLAHGIRKAQVMLDAYRG